MPNMADERLHELRRARAALIAQRRERTAEYTELARRQADLPEGEELPDEEKTRFDEILEAIQGLDAKITDHDARIERLEQAIQLEAGNASDTESGERNVQPSVQRDRPPAQARAHGHEDDRGLVIAGCAKMMAI
jgi:hypothetical protein